MAVMNETTQSRQSKVGSKFSLEYPYVDNLLLI